MSPSRAWLAGAGHGLGGSRSLACWPIGRAFVCFPSGIVHCVGLGRVWLVGPVGVGLVIRRPRR